MGHIAQGGACGPYREPLCHGVAGECERGSCGDAGLERMAGQSLIVQGEEKRRGTVPDTGERGVEHLSWTGTPMQLAQSDSFPPKRKTAATYKILLAQVGTR